MAGQVTAHLDRRHVAVVRNGVDAPVDAGAALVHADAWPGRSSDRRLLFIGRLEYEKEAHILLRALRRLRDAGRPVRVALAGEGTHRGALEALAIELRLRRSSAFLGFCDPPALTALHTVSDVAVVPSLYEPFGLVVPPSPATPRRDRSTKRPTHRPCWGLRSATPAL